MSAQEKLDYITKFVNEHEELYCKQKEKHRGGSEMNFMEFAGKHAFAGMLKTTLQNLEHESS